MKHKTKNEQTPMVQTVQINDMKINKDEKPEVIVSAESEIPANKSDSMNVTRTSLRPSPSETSLTRSRSLQFPTKPKHSPDCKDNPCKL